MGMPQSSKRKLLGSWQLISWEERIAGEVKRPGRRMNTDSDLTKVAKAGEAAYNSMDATKSAAVFTEDALRPGFALQRCLTRWMKS